MGRYIAKRIGQMVLILFLISIFIFMLISFIPGDPVYAMLGEEVSPEMYAKVYHELNLDKPVIYRYFIWLGNALTGNFGQSTQFHMPTIELLAERMPVTLYFTFLSFFISIPVGVLLGVVSAVYRGKPIDTIVTLIANTTACLPQFWIGILLMYVFAMKLAWLPSFGFVWPWEDFGKSVQMTIMPLFCLAIGGISSIARQTRSSMLEVIRQDYIRTARSKGLKENKVIFIHALKNALIPVITLFGMRLGLLIGGSMFMETVFAIPGMGSLFVKAITSRDIPVVQACVLVTALIACLINLLTDILYAVVDPRIKFE
ncbi:peptide/nickel transport system permease protein [Mobilisporobacter senegalensis]|uniref:Peptide/nickel transport system permease protein n=1 Tax=Mobilisporobacter senegalensis TaxID=1329262 RepID=A0A3N1X9K4_9FIRM|nr:ABC transporter permease [Mobilisporobacter senegalensis]ROR23439.1 peptide/nickel transport system permease protein [Mobilisporobacter senegalensis]